MKLKIFKPIYVIIVHDTNLADDCDYYRRKIKRHLNKASAFTAFKRWTIQHYFKEFGRYID
ncbi:MAG: hypothetical protein VSS52_006560 [Thiotrichaceae bacterium]|nr:hypothetical protein [Thiotrichaceae bacterium]